MKKRILFATSEVAPYSTTGGLGQVTAALPRELARSEDLEIVVVSPLYDSVRQRYSEVLEFVGSSSTKLSWRTQHIGIFKTERDNVTFYFVDNLQYFGRERAYGYYDDGERFAYFCKAVFSVIEMTRFYPDVIHANDWQTALIPLYLKTRFANKFSEVRSVFTVHNLEYQGQFSPDILFDVFDLYDNERSLVDWGGCVNLMKGAIVTCDKLTTVSPTYASEIQYDGGYGLEPIIRDNSYKLTGIINGIDTAVYNPKTDKAIFRKFSLTSMEGKVANKHRLQELFGLEKKPDVPLLCMITRLVSHKGIDLLTQIGQDLMEMNIQFLLLGIGEYAYEMYFSELATRYPGKVGASITFNNDAASMIYAGADMMLMPSRSEPCGLAQMISCRYGTIPIVRETGGLKDTVRDCRHGDGNGFTFSEYNSGEFLYTIKKAIELYSEHRSNWRELVAAAMRSDFSWKRSAERYIELYSEITT